MELYPYVLGSKKGTSIIYPYVFWSKKGTRIIYPYVSRPKEGTRIICPYLFGQKRVPVLYLLTFFSPKRVPVSYTIIFSAKKGYRANSLRAEYIYSADALFVYIYRVHPFISMRVEEYPFFASRDPFFVVAKLLPIFLATLERNHWPAGSRVV